MDKQIGCLLIAQFPLACELSKRCGRWETPVVVTRSFPLTVWAVSPAAQRAGIYVGQPLREAIACCPTLEVIAGRPTVYQRRFAALLDAIGHVVPHIESGSEGVIFFDLRGFHRYAHSESALLAAVLHCVPASLRPRLGVAPNRFAALLAARTATPGSTITVATSGLAEFLGKRSTMALPVSASMHRRLRQLGIATLADVAAIPRSTFTTEFGPEGASAWMLAKRISTAPAQPREALALSHQKRDRRTRESRLPLLRVRSGYDAVARRGATAPWKRVVEGRLIPSRLVA